MTQKALVAAVAMLAVMTAVAEELPTNGKQGWQLIVSFEPDSDTIISKHSAWTTIVECRQAERLEQEIANLKGMEASTTCIERSEIEALLKKSKTE